MRVEIWSDVVCPWCYLGTRRLERALEEFPHRDDVAVDYRSFQLDPARPRGQTSSRRRMLMSKYGLSDVQVRAMDAKMERTAAAEGLEYHLGEAGLTGNTLDAHQLVHLARVRHMDRAVLDRLYRAYFAEERSLFDRPALLELVSEAGLDLAEARDTLDQDRFVDAVAQDQEDARRLGVTGVPFFVFDGRCGVSGAQSAAIFRQALDRAWVTRG